MVIMAKIMMVIVMRNEDDHHDRDIHLRCQSAWLSRDQVMMMTRMTMVIMAKIMMVIVMKNDRYDKMVLTIKLEGQAAEFTSGVRHGFCDQQNVLRHSRELLERRWEDNINLPFFSVFVFAVPK